jgi:hypothetical protein
VEPAENLRCSSGVTARACALTVVTFALVAVPGAVAKFRMSVSLSPTVPTAEQPVEIVLRTDTTLPPDHRLRLVAVAPGVGMYTAIRAALRDAHPVRWHGLHAWLERAGPREWRTTLRFHGPGRWLLVVPNFGPVGYALPPPFVRGVAVRPGACRVTLSNGRRPSGEPRNAFGHGNGALFTSLWPAGTVLASADDVRPDGSVAMKFPWWRGANARGGLHVTGRRLDGAAPPLRAEIPSGYGPTGFQATGLVFPTEGCWQVTGQAGAATLTFVTRVLKVTAAG